jgi:manganese transport protein
MDRAAEEVLQGKRKGFRALLPFLGPAFIASVAYIDPGNYATNISAGSRYGYLLLWVIFASNLMAVLIQAMSAKLGIATGRNLPEMCRERFSRRTSFGLWVQGELIAMATDVAEFIGAALGLYLLFGIPLFPAALITALGSFAILEMQRRGFRTLEAGIAALVGVVVVAFGIQVFFAEPDAGRVLGGLIPGFQGAGSVLLATGILGATVMPHAIYLHSALTQNRVVGRNAEERRRIFRFELVDIVIAMVVAGAINASMLIVAAALFKSNGLNVQDLDVAFNQFGNLLGPAAAVLFGVGLLVSGLSSSTVGTLSGQVIMQGFINYRIPLPLRRLITMTPALVIIGVGLNPTYVLVLSQVVLSFGIAFALIPLIIFSSDRRLMGTLVNHRATTAAAWTVSILIIALNAFLLYQTFFG